MTNVFLDQAVPEDSDHNILLASRHLLPPDSAVASRLSLESTIVFYSHVPGGCSERQGSVPGAVLYNALHWCTGAPVHWFTGVVQYLHCNYLQCRAVHLYEDEPARLTGFAWVCHWGLVHVNFFAVPHLHCTALHHYGVLQYKPD